MLFMMTASQAGMEHMIISSVLGRHRLAKGGCPKKLAELLLGDLAKVQGDLFNYRGLVHRSADDSLMTYSSGLQSAGYVGEYLLVGCKTLASNVGKATGLGQSLTCRRAARGVVSASIGGESSPVILIERDGCASK